MIPWSSRAFPHAIGWENKQDRETSWWLDWFDTQYSNRNLHEMIKWNFDEGDDYCFSFDLDCVFQLSSNWNPLKKILVTLRFMQIISSKNVFIKTRLIFIVILLFM